MVDGNQAAGKVMVSDANGTGSWTAPANIDDGDWAVSGSDMYSSVVGNVGIGSSSPTEKLDVTGNIKASGTIQSGSSIIIDGTGTSQGTITESHGKISFGDETLVTTGSIGAGTTSPEASAQLEVNSTTKGLLPPRMTTNQISHVNSPTNGLIIFDTDNNRYYFYDGVAAEWKEIAIGTGTITPWVCGNTLFDERDSKSYTTVQIGTQCWMTENLAYLPSVSPSSTGSYIAPYYYVYDYQGGSVTAAKATSNYNTYGVLYNWTAAMAGSGSSNSVPSGVQGICPVGWHLPSDAEWTVLTDHLLGTSVAGGKMKETGITHWNSPNTGATNSSGFTALPGGGRAYWGLFYNLGSSAYFWSTTNSNSSAAWKRDLYYNYAGVSRGNGYNKSSGFAVRCLKDN